MINTLFHLIQFHTQRDRDRDREKERKRERKREGVMRSAALTGKVTAFSRTLRLGGKKERRNDTQEEKARRRQKRNEDI